MSKLPAADWTYADYASLPDDGQKYEVIDGEVYVTPAPGLTHQEIAGRLYRVLIAYVEEHELGRVFYDVDLLFVSGQFLRPDLVYVPAERSHGLGERGVEVTPGLVIEVLSPGSRQIDRVKKPARYRDFGVPDYWVVDAAARVVEVYALARGITTPETFADVLTFQPNADKPALRIEVAKLFAGL